MLNPFLFAFVFSLQLFQESSSSSSATAAANPFLANEDVISIANETAGSQNANGADGADDELMGGMFEGKDDFFAGALPRAIALRAFEACRVAQQATATFRQQLEISAADALEEQAEEAIAFRTRFLALIPARQSVYAPLRALVLDRIRADFPATAAAWQLIARHTFEEAVHAEAQAEGKGKGEAAVNAVAAAVSVYEEALQQIAASASSSSSSSSSSSLSSSSLSAPSLSAAGAAAAAIASQARVFAHYAAFVNDRLDDECDPDGQPQQVAAARCAAACAQSFVILIFLNVFSYLSFAFEA